MAHGRDANARQNGSIQGMPARAPAVPGTVNDYYHTRITFPSNPSDNRE